MFIVSHVQFRCAAPCFPTSRHLSNFTEYGRNAGSGSVSQTERLKSRNRKSFKSQNFLTRDVWFDLKRLSTLKLRPVGYL